MSPEEKNEARNAAIFVAGAVAGLAIGTLVGVLLAPRSGRTLRKGLKDRASRAVHAAQDAAASVPRTGRYYRNRAKGALVRIGRRLGVTSEAMKSDRRLADRVRSVLGRMPVDIGSILVDCVGGTCTLRGGVPRYEMIGRVEKEVRAVPGVLQVNNMLHTQHEP